MPLSSMELSLYIMGFTPYFYGTIYFDLEVYLFYGTKDDFQVSEITLARSESFWFKEPRAKRKD